MKAKRILIGLLSTFSLFSLFSCGEEVNTSSSNKGNLTPSEVIYTSTPIFDLNDPADVLSYETEISGNITSIKIGRVEISTYSYGDGVLSLSGEEMKKVTAGEKTITITTDEKSYRNSLMVCTKVIKTALDFQSINDNLSGTYVLGNDIDLSTIANFEPLGYFFGDEQDPKNSYFHGILDGNGYTIKNASVKYSSSVESNEQNYRENYMFTSDAHKAGDNIGIFQIIGSSGVVRNTVFKDCVIEARTIGGIIAGNCSGTIQNCLIDGGSVTISTHFWDDDCNTGSIAGICAGSGSISNVISTGTANIVSKYQDWDDDYKNEIASSGEHTNPDPEKGIEGSPNWYFYGANKVIGTTSENSTDSNGHYSNGVYSGVGKVWGNVSNCYSLSYKVNPVDGAQRDVDFAQTHIGTNKPTSGDTNMGNVTDCSTKTLEELQSSSLYSAFDTSIWNVRDGRIPNIKAIYPTR